MRKPVIKLLFLGAIIGLTLGSCGRGSGGASPKSKSGELVGAQFNLKKWSPEQPKGMVLIPTGSFVIGNANYDIAALDNAPTRTVTVNAFYMDETEITNSEYLQFVFWVRDSLVRTALAEKAESGGGDLSEFAYKESDLNLENDKTGSPYYEYVRNQGGREEGSTDGKSLNWNAALTFDRDDYPNVDYAEVLESFYYAPEDRYEDEKSIDVRRLKYAYYWLNTTEALKGGKRQEHLIKEEVTVYPDTTVWAKDFSYSYNEPMHKQYFWHPAYKDYPVVGVNWKQAKAFCAWRTKLKNGYLRGKHKPRVFEFRLPTEAEWEYAARGGLESAPYPWGGPYVVDDRGCFLANFKPKRGNYIADGYMYTSEAKSFTPNNFGLYNMSGNVSEWTNTSFNDGGYNRVSTLNPNLKEGNLRALKKVIRGGSWKDVQYYLQVGTRDWEWADSARSYIGFRTVQDHPGIE